MATKFVKTTTLATILCVCLFLSQNFQSTNATLDANQIPILQSIVSSWPSLSNPSQTLLPWNLSDTSTACSGGWSYVVCDVFYSAYITRLVFSGYLGNTIPTPITLLTNLTQLSFQNTKISGTIPDLSPLKKMRTFTIKDEWSVLGNLPNLTIATVSNLVVVNTTLNGTIPSKIWQAPNLFEVDVEQNPAMNISELPPSFVNAPFLTRLIIVGSGLNPLLNGTIPSDIVYLTRLTYLDLSYNHLTGSLPRYFASSGSIVSFPNKNFQAILSHNRLNGSLIDMFAIFVGFNCTVKTLLLDNNDFSGSVSNKISYCNNLVNLDLQNNRIEGEILNDLTNLYSIASINLSDNYFTGTIPYKLMNMTQHNPTQNTLVKIFLDNNLFQGFLPASFLLNHNLVSNISFSNNSLLLCNPELYNYAENNLLAIHPYDYCDLSRMRSTQLSGCAEYYLTARCILPKFPYVSCLNTTRPGENFDCLDGKWVSNGSIITEDNFVVTGPTIVNGNLSIGHDLILPGFGNNNSLSSADGCIDINGSVVINLNGDDVQRILNSGDKQQRINLINQLSALCLQDLSALIVRVNHSSSTCKSINFSQTSTSSSQERLISLSGVFNIDSSGCSDEKKRLKSKIAIIVGSSVGAVVLIVFAISMIVTFIPQAKLFIRPFVARKYNN